MAAPSRHGRPVVELTPLPRPAVSGLKRAGNFRIASKRPRFLFILAGFFFSHPRKLWLFLPLIRFTLSLRVFFSKSIIRHRDKKEFTIKVNRFGTLWYYLVHSEFRF